MFKHPSSRKLTAFALAVALFVAAAGPALAGPLVPGQDGQGFASRLLAWAIAWVEDSPLGRWLGPAEEEVAKYSPSQDPDGLAPVDPGLEGPQRPTSNQLSEQ